MPTPNGPLTGEALLEQLRQERRAVLVSLVLYVPIIVLVFVLFFVRPLVALAVTAVAAGFLMLVVRPRMKAYSEHMLQENLRRTLYARLNCSPASETDGGRITEQTVRDARLLPLADRKDPCMCRHGIAGEAEGIPTAMCDVVLTQTYRKKPGGKPKLLFNPGCWLHFDLPRDTGRDWRLLDKKTLPADTRADFYHAQTELASADLPEGILPRFALYVPAEGGQRPTNAVLRQVQRLVGESNAAIAISLRGDRLDVFLRGRVLAPDFNPADAPTLEELDVSPVPELEQVLRLAKLIAGED